MLHSMEMAHDLFFYSEVHMFYTCVEVYLLQRLVGRDINKSCIETCNQGSQLFIDDLYQGLCFCHCDAQRNNA